MRRNGHLVNDGSEARELLAPGDGLKPVDLGSAGPGGDGNLVRARRIINPDAEQEAVQLRFRQRIRAFLFNGILGGHDDERRIEVVGFAVDGDRQFLHRFEQRGLRLGWRAIDFVGKDEVGEHGAPMKHQVAPTACLIALKNFRARDVRRHEVRRELNAPKIPPEQFGERFHHHRFGETGHADDEHVSTANQARDQKADHFALTNDHRVHLCLKGLANAPQQRDLFLCPLKVVFIHSRQSPAFQHGLVVLL